MPITEAVMVPHPPLIIPEVRRGQEKAIQATIDAYHQARRVCSFPTWRARTPWRSGSALRGRRPESRTTRRTSGWSALRW